MEKVSMEEVIESYAIVFDPDYEPCYSYSDDEVESFIVADFEYEPLN